jgi:hypothetical protein
MGTNGSVRARGGVSVPQAAGMTSTLLVAPPPVEPPPPAPGPHLWRVGYEPEARTSSADPAPWRAGIGSAVDRQTRSRSAPPRTHTGPDAHVETHAERVEALRAAARLLRTALEVFDGRRPVAHIADQAAPAVLRYWRVAALRRHVRTPARFTRMRLCLPRTGIAEVAVTCDIDGRPRALAARFERTGGRWLCTAVRLG